LREALGAPQMGWLLAVLCTVIRQSKVGAEYLHPNRWKGHDLGPLRTRRRIPNHLRWARYPLLGVQTYLAGAHGQRRIPGQSVNLAHLIWRKPCAPVPLLLYPRWFSTRGYSCCSPLRWGEGRRPFHLEHLSRSLCLRKGRLRVSSQNWSSQGGNTPCQPSLPVSATNLKFF